MSYIGANYTQQLTTPAIDYFSGNGVTTTFTLTRSVTSVFSVEVVVNGVQQNPRTAYSINQAGNLVFDGAPSAGTNNIYVMYNSQVGQFVTPSPGTVGTSALSQITNISSGVNNFTLQTGGSNAPALNVDQNQNVSIAPISQSTFKLQVANTYSGGAFLSDSNVYAFGIQNNGATANNNAVAMAFGHGGFNFTNFIASVRTSINANPRGDLVFGGRPGDGVGFTENMRINSNGHIIKPFQPSFQAFRGVSAANQATFTGDSDILQFGQTFHNVGGHYNTSTFRFTAPVAGRYLFFCTARYDGLPGGSYSRLTFFINGASNSFTYGHMISGNNHSTDYESSCISAVLNLAVGDFVDVRGGRNGGGGALQFESQFSGILIG